MTVHARATQSSYGWYVVAVLFLVMALGFGGAFYLFGVFFPSLIEEFGWTRTQLSGSQSSALVLMALAGPLVGRITDRWGARVVLMTGALLCTFGFLILGRVGTWKVLNSLLDPLGQFYGGYLIFALGLTAIGFIPVNTVITEWFTHQRGLAMGVAATGIGVGGFLMVPLAGTLIDHLGWRQAYLYLGLLISLVIVPAVGLVLRKRPPAPMSATNDGTAAPQSSRCAPETPAISSTSRVFRSAPFRAQSLACAAYNLGVMTVLVHGVSLLIDRGFQEQDARLMVSLLALLGIAGKLLFGFLSDRWPVQTLGAGLYFLQAFAILLLVFTHDLITASLFVIAAGLSMGGVVTLQPMLVASYFGAEAFGTIYGVLHILMAGAAAVGPLVAAYLYDVGGGYEPALLGFVAANCVGAVAILAQSPPDFEGPRQAP